MPLGMDVGLGPGDFAFDGAQLPQKKAHAPHPFFGLCVLCQTVGWIKMPLGMEINVAQATMC